LPVAFTFEDCRLGLGKRVRVRVKVKIRVRVTDGVTYDEG
jgi:hypothetical protein